MRKEIKINPKLKKIFKRTFCNPKTKEEQLKCDARNISIKEGSAYSITDGLGMRYITPYALSLGATNVHIGFLSSVPSLLGNFVQLHTIKLLMKHVPRKQICFWGAILQGLLWLPIIGLGALFFFLNYNSNFISTLLVVFYSLMIVAGAYIVPAWHSWMRDLIIDNEEGHYFGLRNRITGLVTLICMIIAGISLYYFKGLNVIFWIFAALFLIAGSGRLISAYLFNKKYEPQIEFDHSSYFTLRDFLKQIRKSNFGKFVIYFSFVYFAAAIASPFFSVYLLKDLNFNYFEYMLTIVASAFASLLFMPAWGKFADHYGNFRTLKLCGYFIPLVPLIWLPTAFMNNHIVVLIYLILAELFSGFIWAGFNLCIGNFIYDSVSRPKIPLCVTYTNILSGIGLFLGAIIGGFLASAPIQTPKLSSIWFVLLISFIIRLIVAILFSRNIKEIKKKAHKLRLSEIKQRLTTLSPEQFLIYLDLKHSKPRPPL